MYPKQHACETLTDIHDPQRMNPNYFVIPSESNFDLFNVIIYNYRY